MTTPTKPKPNLVPLAAIGTTFVATTREGKTAAGTVIAMESGRERLLCDECSNAATYMYLVAGSQLSWYRCKKHRHDGSPA